MQADPAVSPLVGGALVPVNSAVRSSLRNQALSLPLRQIRCDLREVLEPRRAFAQVPLEPAHCRSLELRRPALGVETDQLEGVLERQVRQLTRGVLGSPECSALDRSAEADVSMSLCGHERMFSRL